MYEVKFRPFNDSKKPFITRTYGNKTTATEAFNNLVESGFNDVRYKVI